MRGFFERLWAMAHKEALHMLRDRQMIYLALGMPVLLILLFGYAVSFDVENARLVVVDRDRSAASRVLIDRFDQSEAFMVASVLDSEDEIEPLFRRGLARGALVIPEGYGEGLERDGPKIQILLDGADGTTARINLGNIAAFMQRLTLERTGVAELPIEARIRTWFNPRTESALFVVPGLVAVILAILAVLLSALTVAREWERGSMEQLFATPADRLSVVLGKVLPYIALGVLQFLLVLDAGAWLFDVPLRGSFLLLVIAVTLFLACMLGQGLLVSMVTRNQQLATQIGAVSAILPSLLLSGFLFPVENMPVPLQIVARVVPGRYMINVLRGVLLQGRGLAELWTNLVGLLVFAIGLVALTTLKFRRRLD